MISTLIYSIDGFAIEERRMPSDLKRKLAHAMGLSLSIFCSPGSYADSYNRWPLEYATFAGGSAQARQVGRYGGLITVCCIYFMTQAFNIPRRVLGNAINCL